MIRTRRWKYVLNEGSTDELYAHEQDPGEFVNRIDDPALVSVRAELCAQLVAWFDPAGNRFRP